MESVFKREARAFMALRFSTVEVIWMLALAVAAGAVTGLLLL